ncbi:MULTISPECIES: hypothetical protein [unclassified Psychrobacillus]
MDIREEIRKQLEGLSQDEIIKVFREAGFNVSKGTGEVNIQDDLHEY